VGAFKAAAASPTHAEVLAILQKAEFEKLDAIEGGSLQKEYERQWLGGKISGLAAALSVVSRPHRQEGS